MRLSPWLFPLVVLGMPLSAQRPIRDTTFWVVGQMVDATTGVPVRRGEVCLGTVRSRSWNGSCDFSDTAGVFRAEATGPSEARLFFGCSPAVGQYLVEMGSAVVTPTMDSGASPHVHRVKARRCDQRPFEVVRGEFTGVYTFGFEAGTFSACGDTVGAWVDFLEAPGLKDVRLPYLPEGVSTAFVKWRGTRVGPGSYGHMGGEPYSLTVDSLYEAREWQPTDCGAVPIDSLRWSEALRTDLASYLKRTERGNALQWRAGDTTNADPWTERFIAEMRSASAGASRDASHTTRIIVWAVRPLSFPADQLQAVVELRLSVQSPIQGSVPGYANACETLVQAILIRTDPGFRTQFTPQAGKPSTCMAIVTHQ